MNIDCAMLVQCQNSFLYGRMVEEGLFWVGCDELTMECISRGGRGFIYKKDSVF